MQAALTQAYKDGRINKDTLDAFDRHSPSDPDVASKLRGRLKIWRETCGRATFEDYKYLMVGNGTPIKKIHLVTLIIEVANITDT